MYTTGYRKTKTASVWMFAHEALKEYEKSLAFVIEQEASTMEDCQMVQVGRKVGSQ
jgi:hypothetical protein